MVYICVVDNNFTNSCRIIISKKILYNSHLILSVTEHMSTVILDIIIKYLNDNNYNKIGDYNNTFYYDCINIIVPYLTSLNIKFTIIDPNKKYCCWC